MSMGVIGRRQRTNT